MINYNLFIKNKKSYIQGEINSYRSDKMSVTLTFAYVVGTLSFIAGTILFIIYKKKDELAWIVIGVNVICVATFCAICIERLHNNYVPLPAIIVAIILMILAGVFASIPFVDKIIELIRDY